MEMVKPPMLVMICHRGISEIPNLSMAWIGAVTGNIVNTAQAGWFGKAICKPRNQSGIYVTMV